MAALTWLNGNWFSLVQTVGILGGMAFTVSTIRRDSKERQMTNCLNLCQRHRELWKEAGERKDLSRVFQADADLTEPSSVAEEEFLNLVFVHYELGWRFARSVGPDEMQAQRRDVRNFFSLPLPRAVWEKTKGDRNRRFVGFVEQALK